MGACHMHPLALLGMIPRMTVEHKLNLQLNHSESSVSAFCCMGAIKVYEILQE